MSVACRSRALRRLERGDGRATFGGPAAGHGIRLWVDDMTNNCAAHSVSATTKNAAQKQSLMPPNEAEKQIELLWDLMVRESSRMRPANKKAVVVQEGERGAVTRAPVGRPAVVIDCRAFG